MDWKDEIEDAVAREDHEAIRALSEQKPARVLRYLSGRLYTEDKTLRQRSVQALGVAAAVLSEDRTEDLLRRFVWALNDESGAVPFGIPEAIGEVLAVRPEFQKIFLPILCSLVTEEEMSQTGDIERGALWAVGRVGRPAARCSARLIPKVRAAADSHPDPSTRATAAAALLSLMEAEEA